MWLQQQHQMSIANVNYEFSNIIMQAKKQESNEESKVEKKGGQKGKTQKKLGKQADREEREQNGRGREDKI